MIKAKKKGGAQKTPHIFYVCFEDLTKEVAWTVHIREVINNWVKAGVDVTLFAPKIWPFQTPPNCRVIYVPTINVRFLREYLYLIILFFYLLFYGLRSRPRAIYCREMGFLASPALIALLFGVPIVIEINGYVIDELMLIGTSRLKIFLVRILQGVNLKMASALVMVSRELIDKFSENYNIYRKEIFFVPNGVDTELFSPDDRKEVVELPGDLKLNNKRRYVTFIGSFYPHSLTPKIVRASEIVIKKYDDVDFLMVGDGHDFPLCKKIASDLGITKRIIFSGIRPHSEIPVIIGESCVLINLIEGYMDLRSMKILEYMSSGGVVISNREKIFGLALTHRENFYHIDETTSDTLSEAIITLLDDEILRKRIGAGARLLVIDNFSWEKTAKRLLEVIDEVSR